MNQTTQGRRDNSPFKNNEMFYYVLQLKTGDTILCQFSEKIDDFAFSPTMILHSPLKVISVQTHLEGSLVSSEQVALKPFLAMSDSEDYPISTDIIVTMGKMKREVRELYLHFVERIKKRQVEDEIEQKVIELLQDSVPGDLQIIESPNDVPPPV